MPTTTLLGTATATVFLIFLTGCATGPVTPIDARKASTADILFRSRGIKQHLENKRAELAEVRQRVSGMDRRVRNEMARLQQIQRERVVASGIAAGSAQKRDQILREVAERQATADTLLERIASARAELGRLENTRSELEAESIANDARREALELEISGLEAQVRFLERANAGIMRRAAEESLRDGR